MYSPLDLTKVRLQASGDKRMIASIRKTYRTAGASPPLLPFPSLCQLFNTIHAGTRGLFDGISGTLLRQMTYSLCRFWAYDQSKKLIHPGPGPLTGLEMVTAGSMAGGIAGIVGNPGGAFLLFLFLSHSLDCFERD